MCTKEQHTYRNTCKQTNKKSTLSTFEWITVRQEIRNRITEIEYINKQKTKSKE